MSASDEELVSLLDSFEESGDIPDEDPQHKVAVCFWSHPVAALIRLRRERDEFLSSVLPRAAF